MTNRTIPLFTERDDSQASAVGLLREMGWTFLSPAEANRARGGERSEVLLLSIVEEQLRRINRIDYRGGEYAFSDGNIHAAVQALRNPVEGGLTVTNERVYDLLMNGKAMEETIEGDRKSHTLRFIDWEHPERNVFHVTAEFDVDERIDRGSRRFDVLLFVNGIPFVAIECKRRDERKAVEIGIKQLLTYQRPESIPHFFWYTQLLISTQPNGAKYGATGTPREYWAIWREPDNRAVEAVLELLGGSRLDTEQDRTLWSLCRPEMVLDLARFYTVFDKGERKIARYQQFFAVRKTMERIAERDEKEMRKGGVIYHTQGSGKSLTMVMIAVALSFNRRMPNPRVIVVTDRKDLDRQIERTFRHCGKEPKRANSGSHLAELINDERVEVITTIINKFDTALRVKGEVRNGDRDIFVLVDESHRTQYGTLHARMRKVLPNACYIGFTGTPLLKSEKSTAGKFGGIIDSYPMDRAVRDGAVVPLLYEGREPRQFAYEKQLNRGFDRIAEPLGEEARADLKRKATTKAQLMNTRMTLEEVVHDLIEHYVENWQGTGFKGQLAVTSKVVAVRAHKLIREDGRIRSAVVISPPDMRESSEDEENPAEEVRAFWKREVEGSEFGGDDEAYERYVIERFNEFHEEDPGIELLIVVSKLLTGFDAPRNTVLYIFKEMREHTLLQAIARVNRLFEGKDFGHIIDYWGILGELDKALTTYSALSGYEEEDLENALWSVREEIAKLGDYHSNLVGLFAGIKNRQDPEEYQRLLTDEEIRRTFYERLRDFARGMQFALSSSCYHETVPEDVQRVYINDLKTYTRLRATVRLTFAESVDFGEYEERVRKLLDRFVGVEEVEQITKPVDIFDREAFIEEVERVTGNISSKAEAMAQRTKKVLNIRMDEDPALFRKLAELIEAAIEEFHRQRIDAHELMRRTQHIDRQVETGDEGSLPVVLHHRPEARACYHTLIDKLDPEGAGAEDRSRSPGNLAQMAIDIEEILRRHKIVDWTRNPEIEKKMKSDVEDYLIESGLMDMTKKENFQRLDLILEEIVCSAKRRAER